MIVDTSAFIAMVFDEPERGEILELVARHDGPVGMSVGSALEAAIVLERRGTPRQRQQLETLRTELGIHLEPATATQYDLARQAYRAYGRGSGHPAQLNFGDCFAYALAVDRNEPLLFLGDDFAHTDVLPAR
ncbi:MAG: type II toxin-antitoxin system VapC family toxin [Thermoleophilia bacterium]|nr:type II toxin-antitoxin system VapC family toxin [Thermoleophilia bacterium]